MGCDIHLHIEVKVDNKWLHYSSPNVDRNYRIFGKMAGVRDDSVEPIAQPKGLPYNLSLITMKSYQKWKMDAHHMSWLDEDEIMLLSRWLLEQGDWLDWDLEFAILHAYLEDNAFWGELPDWVEDVRFVFWFDN